MGGGGILRGFLLHDMAEELPVLFYKSLCILRLCSKIAECLKWLSSERIKKLLHYAGKMPLKAF